MGFFSRIKKFFGSDDSQPKSTPPSKEAEQEEQTPKESSTQAQEMAQADVQGTVSSVEREEEEQPTLTESQTLPEAEEGKLVDSSPSMEAEEQKTAIEPHALTEAEETCFTMESTQISVSALESDTDQALPTLQREEASQEIAQQKDASSFDDDKALATKGEEKSTEHLQDVPNDTAEEVVLKSAEESNTSESQPKSLLEQLIEAQKELQQEEEERSVKPEAAPMSFLELVAKAQQQAAEEEEEEQKRLAEEAKRAPKEDVQKAEAEVSDSSSMLLRLRAAEPKLSAWLEIILEGVEERGELLNERLRFLLDALEAPKDESARFVADFSQWLEKMEYTYLAEFRSELQYRLALALELEDEEDERNRLLLKMTQGLAKTRAQLSQKLEALFSSHGAFDDEFWESLEEIFITADLGYEASMELVKRLQKRVRETNATHTTAVRDLLKQELTEIFHQKPRITACDPPEVILMVGVNGVGKTTTIGKLAHRAKMHGRKVMIAAADTFRAAAIEQLEVWAERSGAAFHSRPQGADPASVAYEAVDRAVKEGIDLLFVDTAGRLQTKTNLMEELKKIRAVLGKKHAGAPHRTVLVIDATTGQNALSQVKLFQEVAGVDELIVTKMDGTAKGGFAIALAVQFHIPISFIGLGEKMEDLRPFSGADFAEALLDDTILAEGHSKAS